MARNNIQFKGIRHSPSDITGQDGDLLECVNLIHENGELKPIEMPEKFGSTSSGDADSVLMAVHNLTSGDLFVYVKYASGNSVIAVKNASNTSVLSHTITGEQVLWVDTIGNTLVFGTDKSTHYSLYKGSAYKWLGDKMPQPIFQFDFKRADEGDTGYWLKEYEPKTNTMTSKGDFISGGGIALRDKLRTSLKYISVSLSNTNDENIALFRDGIRSRVEQVLWNARNSNVFVFPFFIRYAVRMYDGTYAMHSAPILMIPSSLKCPLLSFLKMEDENGVVVQHTDSGSIVYYIATEVMDFRGMELSLQFKGWDGGTLSDWNDVINGVDLFMSSQISSYNERGWDNFNNVPTSFFCFEKTKESGGSYVDDASVREYGHCYTQNSKIDWWDIFTNNDTDAFDYNTAFVDENNNSVYKYLRIPLPEYSENEIIEKIKNVSQFYRVKRYDTEDLQSSWDSIRYFRDEVEIGTLERLETLPALNDDYVSRSKMISSANYNYNQRLILGNISLEAPNWYQDEKSFESDKYSATLTFVIEKPEKTIGVQKSLVDAGQKDFGHYIYYPDPDCKKVLIRIGSGVTKEVPMIEHTGLNGAFALMPELNSYYEESSDFNTHTGETPSLLDRYYKLSNTIAMSTVANPFHFSAENFKDVGRKKIIGIAANVLDTSYNQWGPYPILVFCSDGIVAVTIKQDGTFGGVEAVSADVLLEPQSQSEPTLVQANRVIIFLTKRGVMSIAGTKVTPLSLMMNGRHFVPTSDLKPTSPTPSVLYGVGAFSSLITNTSDSVDFNTFITGSQTIQKGYLAYDYAHNRVLLLNKSKNYQYVLSLDTLLWSKQIPYTNGASIQISDTPVRDLTTITVVPMQAAVNNYTEMYLQDTSGNIYKTTDVANENASGANYQYGYLVSRPVRFGTDEYKTITRMLNRYTHYAANSFAKVALYGSRDGVGYGRVNTLRGMGYQYYIFVIYTYLKPNERYSYLSVDFETRLSNKLR